jgi:hypothetical protein
MVHHSFSHNGSIVPLFRSSSRYEQRQAFVRSDESAVAFFD